MRTMVAEPRQGTTTGKAPPTVNLPDHLNDPIRLRLIAARRALGISQSEMAAQLLTPLGTYQQWEMGRHRTPGMAAVAAEMMCEAEGIEIAPIEEDKS